MYKLLLSILLLAGTVAAEKGVFFHPGDSVLVRTELKVGSPWSGGEAQDYNGQRGIIRECCRGEHGLLVEFAVDSTRTVIDRRYLWYIQPDSLKAGTAAVCDLVKTDTVKWRVYDPRLDGIIKVRFNTRAEAIYWSKYWTQIHDLWFPVVPIVGTIKHDDGDKIIGAGDWIVTDNYVMSKSGKRFRIGPTRPRYDPIREYVVRVDTICVESTWDTIEIAFVGCPGGTAVFQRRLNKPHVDCIHDTTWAPKIQENSIPGIMFDAIIDHNIRIYEDNESSR
jgi:hypothetical protein